MHLEAIGISHRYASRRPEANPVLDDVSISVESGQSVAISGPSGSGKTTLLGLLGLLQPCQAGVIRYGDQAVGSPAMPLTRARELGAWVFQTTNAVGSRSAVDNVALGFLKQGEPYERSLVMAAPLLEAVGLSSAADRRARDLSGGELQRVCIARALAGHPEFVFADEPTGNLDRRSSDAVMAALLQADSKATLLLATHDSRLAAMCDRRMELVNGTLRPLAGD